MTGRRNDALRPAALSTACRVIARPAQPAVAIQVREYTSLHGAVRSRGATVPVPRNGVVGEAESPPPGLPRPLRGLAMTRRWAGARRLPAVARRRFVARRARAAIPRASTSVARGVPSTKPRNRARPPAARTTPCRVIARPAKPAVAIQVREHRPLHGDARARGAVGLATAPSAPSGPQIRRSEVREAMIARRIRVTRNSRAK